MSVKRINICCPSYATKALHPASWPNRPGICMLRLAVAVATASVKRDTGLLRDHVGVIRFRTLEDSLSHRILVAILDMSEVFGDSVML